jgi:hypothetical protein
MSLKREARPSSALEMRRLLNEATHAALDSSVAPSPSLADTLPLDVSKQKSKNSGLPSESILTVTPKTFGPATPNKPSSSPVPNKILSRPSKLDHAFYSGLIMGTGSAVILIASLVLGLGVFGLLVWLLSLFITGPLVTILYIRRSPVPLKPTDALGIGTIVGLSSALVQWLLLVLAYFVGATYFANSLSGSLGSSDALLWLVCLLGLLGCLSPSSAFLATRFYRRAPKGAPKLKQNF